MTSPHLSSSIRPIPATRVTRAARAARATPSSGRFAPLPEDAAERLYRVSRDIYAPPLTAFAAQCLDTARERPAALNICLARDGVSPFLAQRALLRVAPARFAGMAPGQVRLAYLSRALTRQGSRSRRLRALIERYLWGGVAAPAGRLTLIDVGIFGSIQDEAQRWRPDLDIHGSYLIYHRRHDDHNAARKQGFLVGAGDDLGARRLLHRQAIHLLEDLWSGVYESVTSLHEPEATPYAPVHPVLERLGARTPCALRPVELWRLKRVALRGVVDGVTLAARDGDLLGGDPVAARQWAAERTQRLAEWIASTRVPDSPDAWLWRALIRPDRSPSNRHNGYGE